MRPWSHAQVSLRCLFLIGLSRHGSWPTFIIDQSASVSKPICSLTYQQRAWSTGKQLASLPESNHTFARDYLEAWSQAPFGQALFDEQQVCSFLTARNLSTEDLAATMMVSNNFPIKNNISWYEQRHFVGQYIAWTSQQNQHTVLRTLASTAVKMQSATSSIFETASLTHGAIWYFVYDAMIKGGLPEKKLCTVENSHACGHGIFIYFALQSRYSPCSFPKAFCLNISVNAMYEAELVCLSLTSRRGCVDGLYHSHFQYSKQFSPALIGHHFDFWSQPCAGRVMFDVCLLRLFTDGIAAHIWNGRTQLGRATQPSPLPITCKGQKFASHVHELRCIRIASYYSFAAFDELFNQHHPNATLVIGSNRNSTCDSGDTYQSNPNEDMYFVRNTANATSSLYDWCAEFRSEDAFFSCMYGALQATAEYLKGAHDNSVTKRLCHHMNDDATVTGISFAGKAMMSCSRYFQSR